jgi:hypothetical protein
MNNKKNIILFVLLLLQAALIVFLYRPNQNVGPVAANLFKSLSPDQVSSVLITNEQGASISLIKKDGWQISQGEFPTDSAKIEGLIKKLAGMKSSRLVSQTKSSHARLKVADGDFSRKVELGQGDSKITFFLGTSPSAKAIHLRLGEANEVYQVNDLAVWEVQADKESWWQTKYVSKKSADLTGLSISNGLGTIEFVNDAAQKAWQLKPASETAPDAKRVETLVNSLTEISIDSYLAKDFTPKGKPIATITYQSKDGDSTVQVWAKDASPPSPDVAKQDKQEESSQVIKASNSPFYAKAKTYVVKNALETNIKSLTAKPVAEAKAPGASTLPDLPVPGKD